MNEKEELIALLEACYKNLSTIFHVELRARIRAKIKELRVP